MHSASDSYSKLSKRPTLRVGDLTPENSEPGDIDFSGSGALVNSGSKFCCSSSSFLYKTPRTQFFSLCEKCRPRKDKPQLSEHEDSTRSPHKAFSQLSLSSKPVHLFGRNEPGHPLPEWSSTNLRNHHRQSLSFTTGT